MIRATVVVKRPKIRPMEARVSQWSPLTWEKSVWSRLGSNQRPSACEAEAKSEARRLGWSSWTDWTDLKGREHAIQTARRMRSG